ncbi:hybrid sensor histidine kinase/response regulator [Hymenobacter sp.]|jgi:signal transduction histidine kinase/ligand-binding sensor domain-containing protein/HPt (histidine-containing phosphotransfer) domain-containing protein/ActR/RegA family two-component response regulator|uniref:hybrid sensor histidine kinase/response regulator n=1 Tax=Hymenobacter sp. TaxID=1898978 RepID=UPI002ED87018
MIVLFRRLLLLLPLLISIQAVAQSGSAPRYFLRQFGAADGLPQPFVYALAQDHAGYLWIGTAEGLIRYDGTEFVAFTTKDGLAEDFVTTLYVEPRTSQLWVGHYQGGVSRWDGQRFRRDVEVASRPPAFRPKPGISSADTTYANADLAAASVPAARRFPTLHQVLPPGTVPQCVLADREHNVWIGTAGQGLWRWSDRHITFYPSPNYTKVAMGSALFSQARAGGIQSTGEFFVLNPTHDHTSPLITFPEKLLPYPPSVVLYTPDERSRPTFDGNYLTPVSKVLWVGTKGHGLWQMPIPSRRPAMQLVRRLPATLAVTALTQHRNGDLWIGTALDGVYRLPADSTQAAEHFTTANGLLHNTIYALTTDSTGGVWIGTHDTGLAVWQHGTFRYFRFPSGDLDVSALLTDDVGRVWIGTEGNGVLCYEKSVLHTYGPASGLVSPYCYALLPVRWWSSYHGGYRHDFRHEQVLVVHRNSISFADTTLRRFSPAALPGNPLVQDLLPEAAVAWNDYCVWLRTRTGLLCLRTNAPNLLPGTSKPTPTLLASEVDGAARSPQQLKELSATQHQVNFTFRGVSLLPGQAGLQYQYRLLGYQEQWSRPTVVGEAQFPRLGAGSYSFEVQARLGEQGIWSKPVATSFAIATPFWQTWWFGVLSIVAAGAGIFIFVRTREAALRRQKLQLETTVRERTQELRHQKAHIENINAELVVARDVAEASRRAKAQFLANMSHEIRTPMNAVIGLTHLLRQTPVNPEQSEYLEAVQSSSQNLLVIINDILDSSKIEAGKLSLEHTPFRLPELLRRVASMFRFATEAKHLYFNLEIDPAVPAAVFGDSVRLNQVLVNLVGNAVKFTTAGGVTVRVQSTPGLATDQLLVRFVVQDTGIGIPANKLEAIFEDFSQANTSTTRQFGGTGLGLSIARNLVELHSGKLWVESTEGQGSAFIFEIPYLVADPAAVAVEATLAVGRFEPALQVLVAEDNDLNQLVARKTLEAWNVQVTIAANGRLAVEAVERTTFDAVLMDVQMPEMDGYEAARQLRMRFPDATHLPIIGLTASALPEDRALALEAGMNDTLAKPFDPALLYARLAHYTGRTTLPPADLPIPVEPTVVAASRTTTSTPDWTLLEELAGGNEAFIRQIVNTFLTQAPQLQHHLEAAVAAADPSALARTAHKLKGQAAYFGVEHLYDALETLENQAKQDKTIDTLMPLIRQVEQELDQLYPQLQERLTI